MHRLSDKAFAPKARFANGREQLHRIAGLVLTGLLLTCTQTLLGSEPEKPAMVADLRRDLGQPDLPVVVGELGRFDYAPEWRGASRINAQLAKAVQQLDHMALVSSEGLQHGGDRLHFEVAAARELGKRYARSMQGLVSGEVGMVSNAPADAAEQKTAELAVAIAQPLVVPGDVAKNVANMEPLVVEAARRGAKVIVFSECGITGYDLKGVGARAALSLALLICSDAGIPGIMDELAREGCDAVILLTAGGGDVSFGMRLADLGGSGQRKEYARKIVGFLSAQSVEESMRFDLAQIACNQSGWDPQSGFFHTGGSSIIDRTGRVSAVIPPCLILECQRPELAVGTITRLRRLPGEKKSTKDMP